MARLLLLAGFGLIQYLKIILFKIAVRSTDM